MSTPTYPGDRSNDPKTNEFPFRDLSIINQPAGGIEFVNTKDDEMVTVYYKDGSYLRFNKQSTDLLATKDKREHVMGDSRTEVNGNVVNIYNQDVETIQLGDSLNKTGDVDKWQKYQEAVKKLIVKSIHPLKRLFEVKRTKKHNSIDQAPDQKKSGSFASNPSSDISAKTLVTKENLAIDYATKAGKDRTIFTITSPIVEDYEDVTADSGWDDFTSYGLGRSPSSQDGKWDRETLKDQITQKRIDIQDQLSDNEKHLGQNKHRDGGTRIDKIAKDYVGVVGLAFNDMESFRKDPFGKLVPNGIKLDPQGKSVYVQYRPSTLLESATIDLLPGGNYDLTVGQKYDLVVGSGGINTKTCGPMEIYAPSITMTSEQTILNSRGETSIAGERVDISGEIITLRPQKVDRYIEDETGNNVGSLPLNLRDKTEPEQQVLVAGNLGVELNTIMKGGLHVEGEMTFHHQTVPVEYHITETDFEYGVDIQPEGGPCAGSNVIADPTVDKDLPCITEEPQKFATHADILPNHLIGYCLVSCEYCEGCFPVYSVEAQNSVVVHAHHHVYKLPPTKFIETATPFDVTIGARTEGFPLSPHDAIRAIGSRNNSELPVLAMPIKNDLTNFTSVEKFGGSTTVSDCLPVTLNNCDWKIDEADASNKLDTLPKGEGVRTSNISWGEMESRIHQLEASLEQKYKELQDKLAALSSSN